MKTTEQFIKEGKLKHGNKFSYEKTNYCGAKEKLIITCKIHGDNVIAPNSHINGIGCSECSQLSRSKNKTKDVNYFIKKAKEIHGDFYNYDKVEYKKAKISVIITCPKHGDFNQTPGNHIHQKVGCLKCGHDISNDSRRLDNEIFIDRAKEIHNERYDYSLVEYKNNSTKVSIICKDHGIFKQCFNGHILQGQGCRKCASNSTSKSEKLWLSEIGILDKNRRYRLNLSDSYVIVDGIDLEKKIVYEFLGDYWHGNSKIYDKNKLNTKVNKTMGQLHKETFARFRKLRKLGYKVVYIWESDWKNKRVKD